MLPPRPQISVSSRCDHNLREPATLGADLSPPAVDLARADLGSARHFGDDRPWLQALGDKRALLLVGPTPPPLGAGDHLNSCHGTVANTGANTVACTDACNQPEPAPPRKVAFSGGLQMKFAVAHGYRKDDPTADVELTEYQEGRRHTWDDAEIGQFEAKHPIGTKARLAMALMLYLGLRKSDMVRFGPQHIHGGVATVRHKKTGMEKRDELLEIR